MWKKSKIVSLLSVAALLGAGCALSNKPSLKSQIESPNGVEILKKDALPEAKKYTMPAGCVKHDAKAIERGRIFFNELNNESGKYGEFDKKKQFGNCVACHHIEGAVGFGNIGPELIRYNETYIKSGARTAQWVYQKISDPRVDNPHTVMTVNQTSKLFNESEVCDLVSYVLADKK